MSVKNMITLLAALALLTGQGLAAEPDPAPSPSPTTATAEALPAGSADDAFKFFLQEAQVVTASRRSQKKSDSPVAIDVITHEEIERSGARSITDLLRFRVGVDVFEANSIEGNPVMMNIRGIPEEFTQSLQVLIDGRSVVNQNNSGTYWRNLPVALDEIDRIEIVRGPNAALFGANAGQGVINILTKKPGSGGQFNAELGTLGQRKGHLALDSLDEDWGVRGSIYEGGKSSSFNTVGEQPATGNSTALDQKLSVRAIGSAWSGGDLDFSAGRIDSRYTFPFTPGRDESSAVADDYELLKLTQSLRDDLSLELSASRRQDSSTATFSGGTETVYDSDLLLRAALLEGRAQTVVGTSLRYSADKFPLFFSNSSSDATLYAYSRNDNETTRLQRLQRAYASEQLAATDWLSVALAASFENSDTGGQQPAYQGAVILKASDDINLRLSGSRSPTTPSLLDKYGRIEVIFGYDPSLNTFAVRRVEGADGSAPQVSSYEATFSAGLLERRVSIEVTGFQMEMAAYPEFLPDGLINVPAFGPVPGKQGYLLRYSNAYNMVLRGTETTLTFKPALGVQLQLNHTYEDVQIDRPAPRYSYTTPWNKVNALGSTELPWGFNLAGNIGWQGQHTTYLISSNLGTLVPDQAKVDLRLGYRPHKDVEIYALGLNLDHQYRIEAADGLAQTQAYAGGINIAFGGAAR